MIKKLSIFFFGSQNFSLIVLEEFLKNLPAAKQDWKDILPEIKVVTLPEKRSGRGLLPLSPQIKKTAQRHSFEILQPEKLDRKLAQIIKKENSLIVVAGYGKILPSFLLKAPIFGSLNIHPSLLPKYRGPSPIQSAILEGEKRTGTTIAEITEKIDAGNILVQEKIKIEKNDTFLILEKKLAKIGGKLIVKIIPLYIEGKITPLPQNEIKATFTRKLEKQDGFLDFKKPAVWLERMIKAFWPWPSCYTYFKGKILKIQEAEAKDKNLFEKPGDFGVFEGKLAFQTGAGLLVCKRVQMEGKKTISSEDFVRGYLK